MPRTTDVRLITHDPRFKEISDSARWHWFFLTVHMNRDRTVAVLNYPELSADTLRELAQCGIVRPSPWGDVSSVFISAPELAPKDFQKSVALTINQSNIAKILEEAYLDYPRKEGKSHGMTRLRRQIQTVERAIQFWDAVHNYRRAKTGTERKYILLFSTFAMRWVDWIKPEELDESLEDAEARIRAEREQWKNP